MSEWIRIKDFYKNAVGEEEYAYVSKEVYEALEDVVIRRIELETLQEAMQLLTQIQKERLHLYFF